MTLRQGNTISMIDKAGGFVADPVSRSLQTPVKGYLLCMK